MKITNALHACAMLLTNCVKSRTSLIPPFFMASALDRIDSEIKAAMLAKEAAKLSTLRMLKSALKYYQIEKKLDTLSEADLISVVQKQLKQRQDSIESYLKAGRDDLRQKEEEEVKVLKVYLPQGLNEQELETLVKSVIAEVGATSKAQVGAVMKAAIAKAAGRADGKAINVLALKLLP